MSPKTTGTTNEPQKDDTKGKTQAQLDKEALDKANGEPNKSTQEKVDALGAKADKAQETADSLKSQEQAAKQGTDVAGSPVTNGTKSSTDNPGPAAATEGNFSPTTVAPGMTQTPGDGDGPDGNKQRDPNDGVAHYDLDGDGVAEPSRDVNDVENPGEPETIDDDTVNALDAAFGKTVSTDDNYTKAAAAKLPASNDESQDDQEVDDSDYRGSAVRVKKLVTLLEGKKDEFIIYGYGGVEIRLGDLRGLLTKYNG